MRAMTHLESASCAMGNSVHEGVSKENKDEHTLADVVTRIAVCTMGADMPPPVGQSQP
jgi:hypothetical protein